MSLQKCAEPIEVPFGEGRGQIHVFRNNIVLDGDAHWCHLANTFERSVAGKIVSLYQTTLTICY